MEKCRLSLVVMTVVKTINEKRPESVKSRSGPRVVRPQLWIQLWMWLWVFLSGGVLAGELPDKVWMAVPDAQSNTARPETFPFERMTAELAAAMNKLPADEQVLFLYVHLPPFLRAAVFRQLHLKNQTALAHFGMYLSARRLSSPPDPQVLRELEVRMTRMLGDTRRQPAGSTSRGQVGTAFVKSLSPDEFQIIRVMVEEIFPNPIYEKGFPGLALTRSGADTLRPLSRHSPTLSHFIEQGWFIPDDVQGWARDAKYPAFAVPIRFLLPERKKVAGKNTETSSPQSSPQQNHYDPHDDFSVPSPPVTPPSGINCNCFSSYILPPSDSNVMAIICPSLILNMGGGTSIFSMHCNSFACGGECALGFISVVCGGQCMLSGIQAARPKNKIEEYTVGSQGGKPDRHRKTNRQ